MPILDDIMDHGIIGPAFRQGFAKGLQERREQGFHEGQLAVIRRQIEKRFGTLPKWADDRLTKLPVQDLPEFSLGIFDATSIENFFTQ